MCHYITFYCNLRKNQNSKYSITQRTFQEITDMPYELTLSIKLEVLQGSLRRCQANHPLQTKDREEIISKSLMSLTNGLKPGEIHTRSRKFEKLILHEIVPAQMEKRQSKDEIKVSCWLNKIPSYLYRQHLISLFFDGHRLFPCLGYGR